MTEQTPRPEIVRAELARVLQSPGFIDAGRLGPFLSHLVEATLAGQTARIKESALGVDVFDRPPTYDPRIDPIVRVEARRLRQRLDDYYAALPAPSQLKITIPKGAYVPKFEVTVHPDSAASPMPRGWRLAAILAALALTGIALGWWQSRSMSRIRNAPAATVAVLPFENVGAEPQNQYFSDGLAEELTVRLSRVPGLKVISRSQMNQFRRQAPALTEVANKTGASVVVEGSVRRQGDRLRVVARLSNSVDGLSLWSQTFERRMKDVFAIQDEIAQSVANALRVQVRAPRQPTPTPNLEAYNLYLLGRYQANLYSEDGMRRAAAYFDQSLKLEPDYPQSLASASMTYCLMGYYNLIPPAEALAKARPAAQRAIQLDPTLADAHAALGFSLAFQDHNWPAAEAAFRRAIQADDGSPFAHGMFAAAVLLPNLRLAEAEQEFKRALALDPTLSFVNFSYAYFFLLSGRYPEAIAQYQRTLSLNALHPDIFWDLGMAQSFAGRPADARQSLLRSSRQRGENPPELHGLEALLAGDSAQARREADPLAAKARAGHELALDAARLYSMLGETEKALDLLTLAVDRRETQSVWLKSDPRLKSLHAHPRFTALLRRLNLTP